MFWYVDDGLKKNKILFSVFSGELTKNALLNSNVLRDRFEQKYLMLTPQVVHRINIQKTEVCQLLVKPKLMGLRFFWYLTLNFGFPLVACLTYPPSGNVNGNNFDFRW